jgi:hypothetical protein
MWGNIFEETKSVETYQMKEPGSFLYHSKRVVKTLCKCTATYLRKKKSVETYQMIEVGSFFFHAA